jgi:hypothetical protein
VKPTNRFVRGMAVYRCRCCQRSTRQTGRGDNEHVRLCSECYDLAGYENMLLDGQQLSGRQVADVLHLRDVISGKGGDPDRAFNMELLA